MKITTGQLKQIIREEIKKTTLKEAVSISDFNVESEVKPLLKKSLEDVILMSGKGELEPDTLRAVGETLMSARRKYFTMKQSPDTRKAAEIGRAHV